MKKYKVKVPFHGYKVGHIFETTKDGAIVIADYNHCFDSIQDRELVLMVHTGILEEHKDKAMERKNKCEPCDGAGMQGGFSGYPPEYTEEDCKFCLGKGYVTTQYKEKVIEDCGECNNCELMMTCELVERNRAYNQGAEDKKAEIKKKLEDCKDDENVWDIIHNL